MMRRNFAEGLAFIGAIAALGRPKVWLDGGPTYDELTLVTNLTAAEFSLVVEVDGERRIEMTGQELLDREAYDGRPVTSGQFVLSFVDALARSVQGENMTGLVTQPGQRVMVGLEIGGAVAAGSPVATLYHATSPNRMEEFRLFVLPEQIPVTTTGRNPFSGFRRGSRPDQNYIRRVFNYGAITHLEIEQDRRSVYGKNNLAKAVNDGFLKRNGKTVPTSSTCFVFDPIVSGNVVLDMLDTYSSEYLRATYTTSSSAAIRALTEYVQRMVFPQAAA